jgi:hypothetical protein
MTITDETSSCCAEYNADSMDMMARELQHTSLKKHGNFIHHLCSLMGASTHIGGLDKGVLPTKALQCSRRNASVEKLKQKWRCQQISCNQKFAPSISATFRHQRVQCVWCGYLRKEGSVLSAPWQSNSDRWFELRCEPSSQTSGQPAAVLQYAGRGGEEKRLVVLSARRESRREDSGRTVVSLAVAGRSGGVRLSTISPNEANALVSHISAIVGGRSAGAAA